MTKICTQCGTAHTGPGRMPGSGWIEFVLWMAMFVPGMIYSIWRRGQRQAVCASCGSKALVDVESPVGRSLVATHYPGGLPAAAISRPASAAAVHFGRRLGRKFSR